MRKVTHIRRNKMLKEFRGNESVLLNVRKCMSTFLPYDRRKKSSSRKRYQCSALNAWKRIRLQPIFLSLSTVVNDFTSAFRNFCAWKSSLDLVASGQVVNAANRSQESSKKVSIKRAQVKHDYFNVSTRFFLLTISRPRFLVQTFLNIFRGYFCSAN